MTEQPPPAPRCYYVTANGDGVPCVNSVAYQCWLCREAYGMTTWLCAEHAQLVYPSRTTFDKVPFCTNCAQAMIAQQRQ